MFRSYLVATLTTIGLPLSPTASASQQRFAITAESQCADCRIELTHIGVLEGNDTLQLGATQFIRRDSKGRYYTTNHFDRGVIVVFDSAGHIIERIEPPDAGQIDRGGIGGLLIDHADTLRIFDVDQYLVVAPNREVVRRATFSGKVVPRSYAQLPSGDVVINANMLDPDLVGFPFHLMNARGEHIRSFGPDSFLNQWENRNNVDRRITAGAGGGLWAAFPSSYVLEHWTSNGKRDRVLERPVPWFPPNQENILPTPDQRPVARMAAVSTDRSGKVWTIVQVADSRWADGLKELDSGRFLPIHPRDVWDSVIEVIDPVARSLTVSNRFDQHIIGFVDERHVFGLRYLNVDATRGYDVWRIELVTN